MFTTSIHASEFEVRKHTPAGPGSVFVTIELLDGTRSSAGVFLETPAKCDKLIKAASRAKAILLSEDEQDEDNPPHRSGQPGQPSQPEMAHRRGPGTGPA